MGEYLSFFDGLLARLHGPMSFRFLLQPALAAFFAIRDSRTDAREGRPPYIWALISNKEDRRDIVRSAWKSVGKVFVIAVVLDLVFQYVALHRINPLGMVIAAVIAAVILAIIPYVLFRGPISRLTRPRKKEVPQ